MVFLTSENQSFDSRKIATVERFILKSREAMASIAQTSCSRSMYHFIFPK